MTTDPTEADGAEAEPQDGDDGAQPRAKYSPLVRRLADEFGVDLAAVKGTGTGGRITRDDVHRAAFPGEPLPGSMAGQSTSDEPIDEPTFDGPEIVLDEIADIEPAIVLDDATDLDEDDGYEEDLHEAEVEVVATVVVSHTTFNVACNAEATQLIRALDRIASQAGRAISLDALLVKILQPILSHFPEVWAGLDGPEVIGFRRSSTSGMVTDVVSVSAAPTLLDVDLAMNDAVRHHHAGDEPIVAPLTIIDAGALGATAITPPLDAAAIGSIAFGRPEPVPLGAVAAPPSGAAVTMTIIGTFDESVMALDRAASLLDQIRVYIEDPILAFVTPLL